MIKKELNNPRWDFYALLIIAMYFLLQVLRWSLLPQFMDIYYHLLTAWGFIQAGGYSGWDFWQYAPFGRIHIYPPFFHIILALLIKLGINKIILAKLIELILPPIFLIALWRFIKKNYNSRLAFFVILTASSSFSSYLSLINNIPATLAIIFGLFAIEQLFQKEFLRSLLLLTLCFYTHIGVSWFFALSFVLYGLFNRQYRKISLAVCICAIVLSIPILFKQLAGLRFISLSSSHEKYFSEFKTLDYILAFLGLIFILRMEKKYWFFLSLFLASFIFLPYPYRFFCAQGYIPIILLSAVCLETLRELLKDKRLSLRCTFWFLGGYILFFSPTILIEKQPLTNRLTQKAYFFDSVLTNMILPLQNPRIASTSLWYPGEYLSVARLIQQNSERDDIIYSGSHFLSVCLASISGRATASGLFPEIGPFRKIDPLLNSKVIIVPKTEETFQQIADRYNLVKIGERKMVRVYKNPYSQTKINIKRASVPFWQVSLIGFAFLFLFYWVKS